MARNKYGLVRNPSESVKRQVRKNSKFGCVVCRAGIYHYDHFSPEFHKAKIHDPKGICCLCPSCHQEVTSGRMSRKRVIDCVHQVLNGTDIQSPRSPYDFHDGSASLLFGGLKYSSKIPLKILSYHGTDLFSVSPGDGIESGKIFTLFSDCHGNEIFRIDGNEFVGNTSAWDIEITSTNIKVRRKRGEISLHLVLDPPGKIIVKRLDMRFKDVHILANENAFAVGRYVPDHEITWFSANIEITRIIEQGVAINFLNQDEIDDQIVQISGAPLRRPQYREAIGGGYAEFRSSGTSPNTEDVLFSTARLENRASRLVVDSFIGVAAIPVGIVIANRCGCFNLREFGYFKESLSRVRRAFRGDGPPRARTLLEKFAMN